MKRSLRRHWDLWVSLVVAAGAGVALPAWLKESFLQAMYQMGISVLSIIFSVFFAALAVIISAGDDAFVRYLRGVGLYDRVLWQFRFTLRLLFLSLIYSIVAFAVTAAHAAMGYPLQASIVFVLFAGLFLYSLLASVLAVGSALRYAQSRIVYLETVKRQEGEEAGAPPTPGAP